MVGHTLLKFVNGVEKGWIRRGVALVPRHVHSKSLRTYNVSATLAKLGKPLVKLSDNCNIIIT